MDSDTYEARSAGEYADLLSCAQSGTLRPVLKERIARMITGLALGALIGQRHIRPRDDALLRIMEDGDPALLVLLHASDLAPMFACPRRRVREAALAALPHVARHLRLHLLELPHDDVSLFGVQDSDKGPRLTETDGAFGTILTQQVQEIVERVGLENVTPLPPREKRPVVSLRARRRLPRIKPLMGHRDQRRVRPQLLCRRVAQRQAALVDPIVTSSGRARAFGHSETVVRSVEGWSDA